MGNCKYTERFSGWDVRAPTDADAGAVREVQIAAATAAWGDFLGTERIEGVSWAQDHPTDLVAGDEEGVCGFVAWDEATGEVTRLYVHPRAWGRGVGTALLARAESALAAAGCAQAWLVTEERGGRTRRFYERLGWRQTGEVRERDWHGVWLREPRYVKPLRGAPD